MLYLNGQEVVNRKIGEETQRWGADSKYTLLSYSNAAYQHIHMPGKVWPTDGTVVTVVSSATEKTFGDFVELIGAGDITAAFDIHWATVTDIDATGAYVVELQIVDDEALQTPITYLTSFPVSRGSNFDRSTQVLVQMPPAPSGSRVGARVSKGTAGAGEVSFIVQYHEYE